MTDAAPGSWTDTMSGRERVRAVVETLDSPASVQDIAEQADVSRATADDELQRLEDDNRVRKTLVDDKKGYELNPIQLFFDELQNLIEEHSQESLEAELEHLEAEREDLKDEFDADSLKAFRERLADNEELTAEEIREMRNVAATWSSLTSEIKLVRHALRLYGDVSNLATAESTQTPSFS